MSSTSMAYGTRDDHKCTWCLTPVDLDAKGAVGISVRRNDKELKIMLFCNQRHLEKFMQSGGIV